MENSHERSMDPSKYFRNSSASITLEGISHIIMTFNSSSLTISNTELAIHKQANLISKKARLVSEGKRWHTGEFYCGKLALSCAVPRAKAGAANVASQPALVLHLHALGD